MDRGLIARRYATALWMYATKCGSEDEVYAEAQTLLSAFTGYPALRRVLESHMISAQKKEQIAAAIAGDEHAGSTLRRFVQLLISNHREEFLREICLSYQGIYRREKRLLNVSLTTAQPVRQSVEQHLRQKLEASTGQTVNFTANVDPSIVGGYILRWDTYRLDASVAGRLRQVRTQLIG